MNKDPQQFTSNEHYSIGVEIEFQILDKDSYDLVPLAPLLLKNSPEILSSRITHEFIRSILELQTGVCQNVADVENDLMETCSMAKELAGDNGCILHASSLHPFAKHSDQVLTSDERYERIMNELQIVGRKFISQGLHIHIGLPDGDTAIRVCNSIQPYLPLLLSLSTSSPYSDGEDTGLLSYRTKLFEVLPQSGLYESFDSWQKFIAEVEKLRAFGIISSLSDLWWDTRPNPHFGTVEIRVCDLPGRFGDILALVAIIQSLVAYLVENVLETDVLNMQIMKANKWQAVRYGLDGRFIDPLQHLNFGPITVKEGIQILVDKLSPYAAKLGCQEYMALHKRIVDYGTSAHYQREIYSRNKNFKEVIHTLHQGFWK